MSIYSNVTEQDLDNLRKLAQQQKQRRALKIKNRFLKQTHDEKLAQSLSPITDKLEETRKNLVEVIKESTQNLGNVIKENNTTQVAIVNTPTTQQPIENNEGVIYDVELENTLNKMKDNTGFFKSSHDSQRGWMINIYPIKMIGGTKVEINDNEYNITSGLQKVFTNKSYDTANSMKDMEKVIFRDILQKTNYNNRKRQKGTMSGREIYIQNKLDDDVRKILNLDKQLKGKGVEKIIIPSNIIDIYTRLEFLLGLKLSGHTDTLTEASNLIDELYKRGEIQPNQQYRNAPNKFQTKIHTNINVFILEYTYIYEGVYTFIKHYVMYNYTSMNTRVYLQL